MSEKKCKKCGKIMDINDSYNTCENCRTKNIENVKKYTGLMAGIVLVSKVALKIIKRSI
ncbi:hypothetical protein [Fusobacterium polymorphum]|jgi:hypothetical protein|uniref:hypothetical protein n=1 Tax=Fusobacterium nucleatum subsp. polymorphum TaxID=76857 RepID=UPI00291DC9A3|nr:hypothetical protein FNCP11_20840 [Fusobacterium nucleatum]BEP11169.1 hypothetical protein FNSP11_20130 [Fusobacterium nucleatum]